MKHVKVYTLIAFIMLVFASCAGCSHDKQRDKVPAMEQPAITSTLSGFTRHGAFYNNHVGEPVPVVFQNRVIVLSFVREAGKPIEFWVVDYDTQTLLYSSPSPDDMTLITAIVENGELYVFGPVGLDLASAAMPKGNHIEMFHTSDLVHWSAPTTVYTLPPDQGALNLSVTKTPDGFVMAYDVTENGITSWYADRFIHSSDLLHWTQVGGLFQVNPWSACATIRYADGYYYLFYCTETVGTKFPNTTYYSRVARSKDLVGWEFSTSAVLWPDTSVNDGIDATDLDFAEKDGKLYCVYLTGDQHSWGGSSWAVYNGTFRDLLDALTWEIK